MGVATIVSYIAAREVRILKGFFFATKSRRALIFNVPLSSLNVGALSSGGLLSFGFLPWAAFLVRARLCVFGVTSNKASY